ncbi:MAG: type IV pilin N-terminal domain-containing protein [Methanospirillum sp.]|uniref:type IV pilin N-terminal domain-containing protein n=1 Tax=Methanospirillum sp. TaxID=45200 RepID=UPI00236F812E|nr:type IV pilin N-terminal domain-containing protein [Methanospirillum sp.]MDD1730159.1 type IV pilin N-terminal domain-containing protein [Methanospirillum sp.]
MKDCAVSEVIGGVLLISIVITGMAIIGVFLISSPPPEAQPHISFLVYSCCEDGRTYNSTLISHQGGSSIKWSDIKFLLNNEVVTPLCSYSDEVNTSISKGNGTSWNNDDTVSNFSTGDTLKIVSSGIPHHLIIFESVGANQTILDTEFTCFSCN